MGWQRFNRTTRVFEVSDDNGGSWQVLKIAAAGTDASNVFDNIYVRTAGVTVPTITTGGAILAMSAVDGILYLGGDGLGYLYRTGGQLILNGGSLTSGAGYRAGGCVRVEGPRDPVPVGSSGLGTELFTQSGYSYLHSYNPAGSYGPWQFIGTTCAMTNNAGGAFGLTVNGTIVTPRTTGYDITSGWNIFSTAPIYPGRLDTGWTVQTSWYFAGHGSYGLYCNTGLYIEAGLWSANLESRAHVRAATGLYDYARGTPIGVWVYCGDLSAVLSTGSGAMYMMFIGKTFYFCCYGTFTATGNPTIYFGNWVVPSRNFQVTYWYYTGTWKPGMLAFGANSPNATFYDNTGSTLGAGTKTFSLNISFEFN